MVDWVALFFIIIWHWHDIDCLIDIVTRVLIMSRTKCAREIVDFRDETNFLELLKYAVVISMFILLMKSFNVITDKPEVMTSVITFSGYYITGHSG